MIPILTSVALRSGTSPSKLLMPMTFASQIGGMATPIGTSLNLLVIGSAASLGVDALPHVRFLRTGSARRRFRDCCSCGSSRLDCCRIAGMRWPTLRRGFSKRNCTSPRRAAQQARRSREAKNLTGGDMAVQAVLRTPGLSIAPLPDVGLRAGDQLVVRDSSERLMEYAQALGATLYSGDTPVDAEHPLTRAGSADRRARAHARIAVARPHARAGELRLALPAHPARDPSARRACARPERRRLRDVRLGWATCCSCRDRRSRSQR